jgi:hypothetical protein
MCDRNLSNFTSNITAYGNYANYDCIHNGSTLDDPNGTYDPASIHHGRTIQMWNRRRHFP